MSTRWAVSLLLGIEYMAGCGWSREAAPQVLWRPPIANITLVQENLKGRDDAQWPRVGEKPIPVLSVLTNDQDGGRDSAGKEYGVTVGESGAPTIRVFDHAGQTVGFARGLSVPRSVGNWWMLAEWGPQREQVAISLLQRGGQWLAVLGIVRPPSLEWSELVRTTGRPWLRAIWIGNQLILIYNDRFVAVDPGTGHTHLVWQQPPGGKGIREPMSFLPSASRDSLLFDVMHEAPERREGIWMLRLTDGSYQELTYEDADEYTHRLLCWESPGTLLFYRRSKDGRLGIYRAVFSPA